MDSARPIILRMKVKMVLRKVVMTIKMGVKIVMITAAEVDQSTLKTSHPGTLFKIDNCSWKSKALNGANSSKPAS